MSDPLHTEELLRKQMEGAELTPTPESWKLIRRKLVWKQFLRFHPGRFNIYYAGVLLLAAAGTLLVLRSAPGMDKDSSLPGDPAPEMHNDGQFSVPADESSALRTEQLDQQHVVAVSPSASKESVEGARQGAGVKSKALPDADREEFEATEKELAQTALEQLHPAALPANGPVEGTQLIPEVSGQIDCSVRSGCAPLTVQFSNRGEQASSMHWSFGNGEESSQSDPLCQFMEPGTYKVSLSAYNSAGDKEISTVSIEVLPSPVADFQVEEGLAGLDNHVVLNLLNYSSGAAGYSWSLMDRGGGQSDWSTLEYQPTIGIKDLTTESRLVRLAVINEFGCSDTAMQQLPVIVESSETRIKFPTAFSPNPSGPGNGQFSPGAKRIDLFYPVYIEVPADYHMKVFTRRGELLFETREVYRGWDGYIQQERAPGEVYVWMVEGKWADGQPFSYRGDVTVIWSQYW